MLSGHRRLRLSGGPLSRLRGAVLGAGLLRHNDTPLVEYPETDWDLVAFPARKGPPYVADNLATVNSHAFLNDPRFRTASSAAEKRWTLGTRDIRWRLHTFLWAIETALSLHDEGALVELGTGNGFMAAGACDWLDWGSTELTKGRSLWLVDSFASERPDERGLSATRRFFYADGDTEIREYFARFSGVRVVTGWLPDAVDAIHSESVAFVHVDLNFAASEIASLDRLAPRLRPQAIVLFDDSGNPGCEDQLEAHRGWAAARSAPFLQLASGQGLCILP
jgi:hypothetical protein